VSVVITRMPSCLGMLKKVADNGLDMEMVWSEDASSWLTDRLNEFDLTTLVPTLIHNPS
jgi:hypothetical protein